jgi:hypothetical protein
MKGFSSNNLQLWHSGELGWGMASELNCPSRAIYARTGNSIC